MDRCLDYIYKAVFGAFLFMLLGCSKTEDVKVSRTVSRVYCTKVHGEYADLQTLDVKYDRSGRIVEMVDERLYSETGMIGPGITRYVLDYRDDSCVITISDQDGDVWKVETYWFDENGLCHTIEFDDGNTLSLPYDGNMLLADSDSKFTWSDGNVVRSETVLWTSEISISELEYYEELNPFYNQHLDPTMLALYNTIPDDLWLYGFFGAHNRNLVKSVTKQEAFMEWTYDYDSLGRISSFVVRYPDETENRYNEFRLEY